jgi:hypothetical protein
LNGLITLRDQAQVKGILRMELETFFGSISKTSSYEDKVRFLTLLFNANMFESKLADKLMFNLIILITNGDPCCDFSHNDCVISSSDELIRLRSVLQSEISHAIAHLLAAYIVSSIRFNAACTLENNSFNLSLLMLNYLSNQHLSIMFNNTPIEKVFALVNHMLNTTVGGGSIFIANNIASNSNLYASNKSEYFKKR